MRALHRIARAQAHDTSADRARPRGRASAARDRAVPHCAALVQPLKRPPAQGPRLRPRARSHDGKSCRKAEKQTVVRRQHHRRRRRRCRCGCEQCSRVHFMREIVCVCVCVCRKKPHAAIEYSAHTHHPICCVLGTLTGNCFVCARCAARMLGDAGAMLLQHSRDARRHARSLCLCVCVCVYMRASLCVVYAACGMKTTA